MLTKKGMSPLIATVLLIAFAVALGAMIMNWSTEVDVPDAPKTVSSDNPCGQVSIQLNEVFDKTIFCYQNDAIRFNVVNTGSKGISGIQLRTVDANLKEVKQDIPSSSIPVGGTFDKDLPYDKSGKVHVELVPYVLQGDEPYYCVQRRIVQDILPACDAE